MRSNLPVTQNEIQLTDATLIVSKTNLKGMITYVNRDFINISGFSESEVMGQPHNIVRHPDMPPEAFEDLWRTLKSGRPWIGLVKNRCKNGDYYWVDAHATPITENGQVTGFMSVRKKASREQIEATERIYRQFRENKAGSMRISLGGVVTGLGLGRKLADLSLKTKLGSVMAGLALLMVLIGGMGLVGMSRTNEGLRSVYEERTIALYQIGSINRLILRNRVAVADAVMKPTAEVIERSSASIEKNVAEVTELWKAYMANPLTPEEKALADQFATARGAFVKQGLLGTMELLRANKVDDARAHYHEKAGALNTEVAKYVVALQQLQMDAAKKEYADSLERYSRSRITAIGLIVAGLLLALGATIVLIRAIVRPLNEANQVFANIAGGTYGNFVNITRNDEVGRFLQGLEVMQTRLGFDVAEAKRQADETLRIKIALDNVSTGVMIANTEREIIYANGSVIRILKGAESGIRKVLPNFSADKMIGINIDDFHKNPKHQADLLATLNKVHTASLNIGGRHMVVTASPVTNAQNERLGSVAEWQDRTAEVAVEEEVAGIVQGAMMGDFGKRLSLEGKEGFLKTLAEGLNRLSETTSTGLNDVARVLQSVAQGDLTEKIDGDYEGIFGQLKDDTNATVERLREVIGRIKEASEAINTAAKEISAGNVDLSSRTEEQASSLEETASSMEELNSTVKQNADNANQANTLARSSNDVAVKSGQMVQQIVSTMTGISESSKKIADIIGVIDSIAFQTNILALNAAVEAARAGEQGRGFAVVATEVRNLAHRSATAAKEIKELIVESGGKVDIGTKLVDQAGISMTEVVTSFSQVTALVTDIANASREQSSGIEQVTQAVGQMDEVTQQNAALVEESAAAAESLEEQAHGLVQAVAMFKLTEGDGNERSRNLPGPALRTTSMKQIAKAPGARAVSRPAAPAAKRLPPSHLAGETDEEWSEF